MIESPLLELTGVSKSYDSPDGGPALEVLKDITWTLGAGRRAVITGPSGSGKSTLLNIIAALDRPSAGTVRLDGRDLCALGDMQLAIVRNRRIGLIFQMHHLLPQLTVWENILVPTLVGGDGDEARARRLLQRVGLAGRLGHFPGQLSGGECQRVATVRALVNGPALVLADEPTGSLDRAAAANLADLLVELNEESGTALIVATHSRELAERVGGVLELRDGRLAPRGGP